MEIDAHGELPLPGALAHQTETVLTSNAPATIQASSSPFEQVDPQGPEHGMEVDREEIQHEEYTEQAPNGAVSGIHRIHSVYILTCTAKPLDLGQGLREQLERIMASMSHLHQSLIEHQRVTDARLIALDDRIRDLQSGGSSERPTGNEHQTNTSGRPLRADRQPSKDSSANYLRVSDLCLVAWVACKFMHHS